MSETLALLPPTSVLPPATKIASHSVTELQKLVDYIRVLYSPEVRGIRRTRRRDRGSRTDTFTHSQERDLATVPIEETLQRLRADPFERAYAIRWLTSLVSRADDLTLRALENPSSSSPSERDEDIEGLVQEAAAHIAICAGVAASGRLTRVFRFPVYDSKDGNDSQDRTISISLTDAPLENADYGTVGTQTWGAACVLAEMVVEDPEAFLTMGSSTTYDSTVRVLELGAGTGLVGMTVAKLLAQKAKIERVEVALTDFHPSVLQNLQENVANNFILEDGKLTVNVERLDWSAFPKEKSRSISLQQNFDVVFGADIIYEVEHALWIKSCLEILLAKNAVFHLLIPLRSTHVTETETVENIFGSMRGREQSNGTESLVVVHRETFTCDAHSEDVPDVRALYRGDEVEYAYFMIGWS